MKIFILPLLALAMCLTSCLSDVDLDVNGGESRIFFYCELEANNALQFKIHTVKGVNDLQEEYYPIDVQELNLEFKEGTKTIYPAIRYNPIDKEFESPRESFTANTKEFYSVNCHFQEFPNLKNISAETYIPEARKIDKLEVVKLDKKGEEQGLELNLEFRFTLDPKHTYYEISAYVFDEFSQDFQKFPVDLNLKKFEKGIFKVDSRKSLFINTDIVNDQFIYATVDTYLPERLIASLDKIYFKLSTINKEHYMFQQNFVRRQESSQAPLSEPVIFYSNIDNGLGLLTGYSSNIDSLSIK